MPETEESIDYSALFAATPAPYLILTTELVICEVNQAYLAATARSRDELLGQHIFDAFPDNPDNPDADGVRNLGASLRRVVATGKPDVLALLRYDVPTGSGGFEERWWSPFNVPVLADDGSVALVIHWAEDATAYIRQRRASTGPSPTVAGLEIDLFAGARKLAQINEQLRAAHGREHEIALRLQHAMLPAELRLPGRELAVRYQPSAPLEVSGDWFDLLELVDGRLAVSVGDVVGRGLGAAGVMGQLRSALSAAALAVERPGVALDVLDRFARRVPGATGSTAIQAVIDTPARTVTYASAGHPPPMLVHPDGAVKQLDEATDPPLGARPEPAARPEAVVDHPPGSTLVLYTDGLIERRGEDISVGLARLADTLARHAHLHPEEIADAVLSELRMTSTVEDDTALLVLRL